MMDNPQPAVESVNPKSVTPEKPARRMARKQRHGKRRKANKGKVVD